MGRIVRSLLFLISLINFAISICILSLFLTIPVLSDAMIWYQAASPWLNGVFAGCSVLICVIFLILMLIAVFTPGERSNMVIAKGKGKLYVSKQTIESTIRYSFADIAGINDSKVRVKISRQPEKSKIYIKLSLNDSSRLVELTETIQEKIESSLKLSLGIAFESIDIKVAEFNRDQKAQKDKGADTVKGNRVI